MINNKPYACINAKLETFQKFELILNHIKPKSTRVDLIEFIIDTFIETKNIPIPNFIKKSVEN